MAGDTNRSRCVEHMHGRVIVRGRDLHCGVDRACCGAADEQGNREALAAHFLGHMDHLVK